MTGYELEEAIQMLLEYYNKRGDRLNKTQCKNMLELAISYLEKALRYIKIANRY